jgi:hypothetical protein
MGNNKPRKPTPSVIGATPASTGTISASGPAPAKPRPKTTYVRSKVNTPVIIQRTYQPVAVPPQTLYARQQKRVFAAAVVFARVHSTTIDWHAYKQDAADLKKPLTGYAYYISDALKQWRSLYGPRKQPYSDYTFPAPPPLTGFWPNPVGGAGVIDISWFGAGDEGYVYWIFIAAASSPDNWYLIDYSILGPPGSWRFMSLTLSPGSYKLKTRITDPQNGWPGAFCPTTASIIVS